MTVKSNGTLFKNDRRAHDKSPEYRGSFNMTKELLDALCHAFDHANGSECKVEIAAWVREGKTGKFFSLSVSPPYEKPQERPQTEQRRDSDADIPF